MRQEPLRRLKTRQIVLEIEEVLRVGDRIGPLITPLVDPST
jgi:hypothetical protein